jgi:hypothetical protein
VGKTHGRQNSTTSSVSSSISSISKSNDRTEFQQASSQDANRHSTHAGEGGKSLNTVSPDVRMASELFSDSPASSAFAEFAPNQNEEMKRLTERDKGEGLRSQSQRLELRVPKGFSGASKI